MAGKMGFLIAGGAIGAALALLYAPRTGEETRAIVADKANEAWGTAQQFSAEAQMRGQQVYSDISSNAASTYENVSAQAKERYSQAADAAQGAFNAATTRARDARDNVKPIFIDKNDDLREKIDAARDRIANQVAKNAEQSGAAEEPVEIEATVEQAIDETQAAVDEAAHAAGDAE